MSTLLALLCLIGTFVLLLASLGFGLILFAALIHRGAFGQVLPPPPLPRARVVRRRRGRG